MNATTHADSQHTSGRTARDFRFVALGEPAHALHCQRVLAIPCKRYDHAPVEHLTQDEATAIVAAPNTTL